MNRKFLLTLSATLLMMHPYSHTTEVKLNSRPEKPPVTGRPDDRKPAGTYARPMPSLR